MICTASTPLCIPTRFTSNLYVSPCAPMFLSLVLTLCFLKVHPFSSPFVRSPARSIQMSPFSSGSRPRLWIFGLFLPLIRPGEGNPSFFVFKFGSKLSAQNFLDVLKLLELLLKAGIFHYRNLENFTIFQFLASPFTLPVRVPTPPYPQSWHWTHAVERTVPDSIRVSLLVIAGKHFPSTFLHSLSGTTLRRFVTSALGVSPPPNDDLRPLDG